MSDTAVNLNDRYSLEYKRAWARYQANGQNVSLLNKTDIEALRSDRTTRAVIDGWRAQACAAPTRAQKMANTEQLAEKIVSTVADALDGNTHALWQLYDEHEKNPFITRQITKCTVAALCSVLSKTKARVDVLAPVKDAGVSGRRDRTLLQKNDALAIERKLAHERRAASVHEAAHAVTALAMHIPIEHVEINVHSTSTPAGGRWGHLQLRSKMGNLPIPQVAVLHLAGKLAEQQFRPSGDAPLAAATDDEAVATCVSVTRGESAAALSRYTILAEALLTLHKDWITATSNALLKRGRLSEAEVLKLQPGRPRDDDD